MTYVTQDQLVTRFGRPMLVALTDRGELATGEIDGSIVDRALADTDALIDGYLLARYVLPMAEVPALITDIAGAIAAWKLHTTAPDPKIEADYKAAMQLLTAIAAGNVRIPVQGVDPAEVGDTGAQVTDRRRTFTADSMRGFI